MIYLLVLDWKNLKETTLLWDVPLLCGLVFGVEGLQLLKSETSMHTPSKVL